MTQHFTNNAKHVETNSSRFLAFELAGEQYALEILKVREIIGMMDITPVPLMPAFIKGLINLRGRLIPVMDLRLKFGMPACEHTAATCIVVVYLDQLEVGVIVDRVCEVMNISAADIEETPSFGLALDTRFIQGIGKTGGRVTILLNIEKALTGQDIEALSVAAV